MIYRCRCGAHHDQPQASVTILGVADNAEFTLCHACLYEARQFFLNRTAYAVDPAAPLYSSDDDDFDDVDAEVIDLDDLAYELHKEAV